MAPLTCLKSNEAFYACKMNVCKIMKLKSGLTFLLSIVISKTLFTDFLQIWRSNMRSMLHQFVQRHIGKSRTIPPTPKLRFSKPFLESQPSKGFYDKFPLSEVISLMDTGQVTRQRANIAKDLKIKTKSADCLEFSAVCLQTSCSLTQQLSSQCVDSRHLGHQLAGCNSAVQSNDS